MTPRGHVSSTMFQEMLWKQPNCNRALLSYDRQNRIEWSVLKWWGKDASVSHCSTLSGTRFPFILSPFSVSQLACPLSACRSVWLIVPLLVLITHPSAHCQGCGEYKEATLPFEENIAQRRGNVEPVLNVWHYNDFKNKSPLWCISYARNKCMITNNNYK